MSLDALRWVIQETPDRTVQEFAILTVMANAAGPDGRGVCLHCSQIAATTGLSERAVQYHIGALLQRGLIALSDQDAVAHDLYSRRRPAVYDLPITGTTGGAGREADQ